MLVYYVEEDRGHLMNEEVGEQIVAAGAWAFKSGVPDQAEGDVDIRPSCIVRAVADVRAEEPLHERVVLGSELRTLGSRHLTPAMECDQQVGVAINLIVKRLGREVALGKARAVPPGNAAGARKRWAEVRWCVMLAEVPGAVRCINSDVKKNT